MRKLDAAITWMKDASKRLLKTSPGSYAREVAASYLAAIPILEAAKKVDADGCIGELAHMYWSEENRPENMTIAYHQVRALLESLPDPEKEPGK